MKHFTITGILIIIGFLQMEMLLAQSSLDLREFNERTGIYNKRGMLVLGGWAVANIGTNSILSINASGEDRYFYRFNIYWNVVNLGLAGIGYYNEMRRDPSYYSLTETIDRQKRIEKTFAFNSGLNVAYIAGGLYLMELSNNSERNADLYRGFGKGLMLQGGFLLVFDAAMHYAHSRNSRRLKGIINNMSVSSSGIGISYHF
jgi:hypothetical protein